MFRALCFLLCVGVFHINAFGSDAALGDLSRMMEKPVNLTAVCIGKANEVVSIGKVEEGMSRELHAYIDGEEEDVYEQEDEEDDEEDFETLRQKKKKTKKPKKTPKPMMKKAYNYVIGECKDDKINKVHIVYTWCNGTKKMEGLIEKKCQGYTNETIIGYMGLAATIPPNGAGNKCVKFKCRAGDSMTKPIIWAMNYCVPYSECGMSSTKGPTKGTGTPKGKGTGTPKGKGTGTPKGKGTGTPKGKGTSTPKGTGMPKGTGTPKGTGMPKGTGKPKATGKPKGKKPCKGKKCKGLREDSE